MKIELNERSIILLGAMKKMCPNQEDSIILEAALNTLYGHLVRPEECQVLIAAEEFMKNNKIN